MKWYLKIAALLVGIAVASFGITAFTAVPRVSEDGVQVVASFYPVYIAAKQVTSGIDGVQVINLVEEQAGCLHDYQLSPDDRVVLDSADALVVNGAGTEPFLDAVIDTVPTVIDLSAGQTLLENGHVHTKEHDETVADEHTVNGHLWVSPLRYRQQVQTLADGLAAVDPSHAAQYLANAATYIQQIDRIWERMQAAAQPLKDTPTVLFHDSLAYAAEDLHLHVVAALNVGEDSGVSAAELAEAEKVLGGLAKALFLYDEQYDTVQYTYLQDLCAQSTVIEVDTCVAGADDADRWLSAMTAFCEDLEAAA